MLGEYHYCEFIASLSIKEGYPYLHLSPHTTANQHHCTEGFKLQRRNIFGFGNYDKDSPDLIKNHAIKQMIKAPVNTITAE